MSVSLALIPVALALRVVMGKEGFESWVDSMQIKAPTSFENELDLVRTVRKAGYDAEKWAGMIKTHFSKGSKDFFFWERVDGRWTAVFAKADSEKSSRFNRDLESKSGRRIFSLDEGYPVSPQPNTNSFPTNFRDGQLLIRTLQEYGLSPRRYPNGEVVCTHEGYTLRFSSSEEGPYSVQIGDLRQPQQMFHLLSALDEDYGRIVQSVAYENLKNKAHERGLTVESEEVLQDNSIVITLNVQE